MADTATAAPVKAPKPDAVQFYKVTLTHPTLMGRVVFRSVSEKRAREFIERRYPRGSEAHLVTPTGDTYSYETERTGPKGTDADAWGPFDPSEWVAPEASVPPGQDEWSDREG